MEESTTTVEIEEEEKPESNKPDKKKLNIKSKR